MTLPAAVAPLSDSPDYATGASSSLALVGFPGPPALDKGDQVDWDWVVRTLFRNRFGIASTGPRHRLEGLDRGVMGEVFDVLSLRPGCRHAGQRHLRHRGYAIKRSRSSLAGSNKPVYLQYFYQ